KTMLINKVNQPVQVSIGGMMLTLSGYEVRLLDTPGGGPEPSPDAGADAGSSQPPGGNDAIGSGGCGCAVAEPSRSPTAELFVLVVGLVPLIRRRRPTIR